MGRIKNSDWATYKRWKEKELELRAGEELAGKKSLLRVEFTMAVSSLFYCVAQVDGLVRGYYSLSFL